VADILAGEAPDEDIDSGNFTAIARGVPHPFPLRCFAFNSARRLSHVAGCSQPWATIASGVGHIAMYRPHILVARHPRPVLRQHLPAKRISLAEPPHLKALALKPQVQATNAREQRADTPVHPCLPRGALTVSRRDGTQATRADDQYSTVGPTTRYRRWCQTKNVHPSGTTSFSRPA
jgi:hypothetical protein